MEGITQEDSAAEVIVIDDSFDGDIFANEASTCTGKTEEAETGEYAELETASCITQNSLATNIVTVSGQANTCSFKGHVIRIHADLPVSPVEGCSGREIASGCLEDMPHADRVEDQELDNPDLAIERCQSAIGDSSNTGCTSVDAGSEFSKAGSSAGEEETHTDAGKEGAYASDTGKSLHNEPVTTSFDSKSIDKSSDGTPVKCSLDKESTSSDVQNDELVTPVSSEELSSHEIPPEVTGKQLKPASTSTASYTSDRESAQSTHPHYIIIQNKNTATKQEAARKPGDKLTSLLQRLTSGKGGKVAVKLSTMTKPLSLPDTKTQAEVNQSSLGGSPAVSVGPPAASVGSSATSVGPPAVSVGPPATSVGSPATSVGSPATSVGPPATSVGPPAVSVGPPATSVGSPATSVGSPATSVGPPATSVGPPAAFVGSPAVSVVSIQDKPAVSPHVVKETSPRTSRKSTLKFPSVSHEPFPISKLPLQTDSATKTDKSQASFKAKTSKTISLEKVTFPATMSSGRDSIQLFPQAQYGTQARKSHPTTTSVMEGKPAEAPTKPGRQVFRVFATNSKQSANSPATPGFPALIPADKIKYVLGYLPVQGSRASNIVFTGPEGQNIILGKAGETYLQPAGVQTTTQKSKYQFSLLQNPASKLSEAVQVNVSPQGRVMKRSPTVRSLLTSSSTAAPVLKSSKLSASETANANASNSLPNLTATMLLQDIVNPSTNTQKNKRAQAHARKNQLAESAQIVLQALSQQPAVTTNGDKLSAGVTTVAFSKLAATPSTSKVPISKACIGPSSASSSTTSGRPIFVMPTALLSTSVPTILTPSSSVSSKSLLAPGIMTYNNISTTSSQSDALKAVFVPKTLEVNPAIQPPANTAHSFSDLIARIALQSVPSTSTNKPSANVKSSMQALNIALLQLRQDLGDSPAPVRIIVSQGSGVKPATTLVYTQSQPSAVSQCGNITTQSGRKITVSKTSPRSTTVTDVGSKQTPKLIYPKPVGTEGVIGASVKVKGVSLLPMSLVAKNQTTSESRGDAVVADMVTNSHLLTKYKLKDVKPRDDQIVEVGGLKEASMNNTVQKPKKVKVSIHPAAPKKPKNVVYAAILRTGQGPVSVKVVAPDMDDDSSDTMSDAGWSNVMFSEESVLASEDTRGKASGVDSRPSNELFESDMPDLVCSEEVICSDQEPHDSCDDAVLNTELQVMGSSIESVVSQHHHVQDISDEETDTDTEVTSMEEQDMSVLRQLLTNTATKSSCDSETTPKFHQFSASSDLMVLSNAGHQPGNAGHQPSNTLSADHEGLTLLTSNSEYDSSVDQVVTDEYIDIQSCDLKIESVFSLRDPGDYQDSELPADVEVCQELPDDQTEPLPAFNVGTSDDWKSFLNPCYVVLERLSKSELLGGGSTKTASTCSGHCRKRTLDYLCNLNLLRCVNHPDPFLFTKSKPRRISIKKTLKKMNKHELIKEMSVPEDMSNSSQLLQDFYVQGAASEASGVIKAVDIAKGISEFSPVVKKTYGKEDVGKSPSLMKGIYVREDGKTHSLVNETYVKEDVGKSPSPVKEIYVTKAVSKSPSMVREIYVKEDGKSPSVVKAARARKTMKKPSPVVKFTFVKEPLSLLSPVTRETCVKASVSKLQMKDTCVKPSIIELQMKEACVKPSIIELQMKEACVKPSISELQMKEACVKETVSTSSPVVKELCGEHMNQFSQKVQEACVQSAMTKPLPVIKETCINKDVVKPLSDCSLSLPSLNQELTHKPPEKALISDSVPLSVASSSDHTGHTSTAQDDQRANDKTTDLDPICSGPGPSKFNRALKQLQRQVNKKRVTMFVEKLSRKEVREPQTKQNVRRCKIKLARQKRTNKVAVKRLRRKIVKNNVLLTTDTVNILAKCKRGYKRARADSARRLINSLPSLDSNVSQDNSPENILPQNKEVCSTDTPGMKPMSDPRITNLSNVQHRNIKTKGQFVRLQPKMPGIPQEKIQSALQSLNSYLAATGRKPTTGNTQFILLKIDDQHVLVKWPAPSTPVTPESNLTMPSVNIRPATSSANNTESNVNIDMNKQKQKEAVTMTAADSSYTTCNPVNSVACTSTVATITANVNGTFTVTNPASNITTFITNIVKPNSESSVLTSGNSKSAVGIGKKEFRIIRTKQDLKKTPSSDKSSPCSVTVPASSTCTQQPVSNVTIDTSAIGIPNTTNSTLKTGPSLNKQTFISLLKSGALTQSHSRALTAFVSGVRAASPIVTSVVSSPLVSDSCSKAGSTDVDSSKKTGSKDTNITLSRLPPNSQLLPGRKRPNSVLSEEERRAKRRRLEEKYPLPPGIVIKSEPDDLQDYMTSVSPGISSTSGISPAFTANSSLIPTGRTESPEPFIMSSDDQVWSVENSVNIGSYLTDTGHPVQEPTRGPAVHGIPTSSAVEYSLSSESCLNAEDSSDEQDEPPALLDETIDDVDENFHVEDINDSQEDVPPVLQPMFTSSCCSLVKDNDVEELESTEFIQEMSADLTTFVPYNRQIVRGGQLSTSADSISTTSLFSESSIDSGVDTSYPSTSFSHTSLHGTVADRPVSKNLKIQYLKELLKKKEMEIENMKRVQSELLPPDFDI